ncbi:MAG: hypothetical protein KDC71_12420 [Acidobacteria bacterium]|nr:hypothetical protein [Acidobacteriota bacterium]
MLISCWIWLQAQQFFQQDQATYYWDGQTQVMKLSEPVWSQTASACVFESDGKLKCLSRNGTQTDLDEPGPNLTYVRLQAPDLKQIALLTREKLYIRKGNQWSGFPALIFSDFLEPQGFVAGSFGQVMYYPQWGSIGDAWFAYQPKTGEGYIVQNNKMQVFKQKKNRVLLALGQSLGWVALPDSGVLSLASPSNPTRLIGKIKIKNLDRHSLVLSQEDRTWLIAFDQGFFSALDAWKNRAIDIQVTEIIHANQQTRVWNLDKMPLNFKMGSSSGGSPKLIPEAGFQVLAPVGKAGLFFFLPEKTYWLDPAKGPVTRTPAWPYQPLIFAAPTGWLGVDSSGLTPLKF